MEPLSGPIKYRVKETQPPGSPYQFWLKHPELGLVCEGFTMERLVANCAEYRRANGLPVGICFQEELTQVWCKDHPDSCQSDDPRAPVKPAPLGLSEVVLGTKVMVSWVKSGFKTVEPEEAERRATICAGCKFNVHHSKGCSGNLCGSLLEILKMVQPHPTTRDDQLRACFFCGCLLQVSVWLPQDIQWGPLREHTKIQYQTLAPENCWKKNC